MADLYSRRRFLRAVLLSGAAAAAGVTYMRYVEPRSLRLSLTPVHLPGTGLSARIRILHLSDLHLSKVVPLDFIRSAIRLGLTANPDLICLTGDYVTGRVSGPDEYVSLLKELSLAAPTYASFGNHDGGSWVSPRGGYRDLSEMRGLFEEADIHCLHNQFASVVIQGQPIELVGLGDLWAEDVRPDEAFPADAGDRRAARIVLCHNPDAKNLVEDKAWDLMLCGHTHGGQLRLPVIGTPFAPVEDHAFVAGLNPWSNRWIYTTRGVGNVLGLRFNCPPQVSVLDVTS
jgi:uncharacterized protein